MNSSATPRFRATFIGPCSVLAMIEAYQCRCLGYPRHQGGSSAQLSWRCYTDPMSTDELLAEALRLTRIDRARVAEELLSSLEEPDDEVANAWAIELERRAREVSEGRVQPVSWPTARTEILKELEQRRASRTPS